VNTLSLTLPAGARLARRLVAIGCAGLVALTAACGGGGGGGGGGSGGSVPSTSPSSTGWVTPTGSWWVGVADGFNPADLHPVYTLTNVESGSLDWTVQVSKSWLSIPGPTQGQLGAGESVDIVVDIDAFGADPGDMGPAVGQIDFLESGSGTELAQRTVLVDSSFASWGGSGWTTFTASPGTRKVYVSSASGNDGNNGLSPATAKRTIAAGVALLRDGYPDWLLLERGGVWNEGLGHWVLSGLSPTEPMLVATYGSAAARPLLKSGTKDGMYLQPGGGSPAAIGNVSFFGLHFLADGYHGLTDQVGVRMLLPSSHVLFEDCEFEAYAVNLVFQGYGGRHTDIRVRRSLILDAYADHSIGHSQGLYAYAVDGLLIEDNVFDHNGWSETIPGAGPDIFNHNLYIDNDNTDVVVRGNIIANAASHGMQLRPGGVCVDNLFVRNSIALQVGGGNHPDPGGVIAEVHDNVILDGKNIDASNPRGWAMWFANVASGHVSGNVVAHNSLGTQPLAVDFEGHHMGDTVASIGVHDLVVEDNVLYDWGGNVVVQGDYGELSGITFQDNDVQDFSHSSSLVEHLLSGSVLAIASNGNHFFSQPVPASGWMTVGSSTKSLSQWKSMVGDPSSAAQQMLYLDPNRSPASYNALLGGPATLAGFLASARQQSSVDWKPEYTAVHVDSYLRGGFQVQSP